MDKSIKARGLELIQILGEQRGELKLILGYIELEQKLAALMKSQDEVTQYQSVEVEEFADDRMFLLDQNIPESVWMETLRNKTGLDIRAILSDLPKEIGMHQFKVAYKENNTILFAAVRVWVVPAKK